VQMFA